MEFFKMVTKSRYTEDKVSEGYTMPMKQYCCFSRMIPLYFTLAAHHRITSLLGLVVLLLVLAL